MQSKAICELLTIKLLLLLNIIIFLIKKVSLHIDYLPRLQTILYIFQLLVQCFLIFNLSANIWKYDSINELVYEMDGTQLLIIISGNTIRILAGFIFFDISLIWMDFNEFSSQKIFFQNIEILKDKNIGQESLIKMSPS